MSEIVSFYTAAVPHRPESRSRLLEEIAYLEARLMEIGENGDCAYEKAMVRSYTALLETRRNELLALERA